MKLSSVSFFVSGASLILLAGCVTRQDIRGLQTDLYNIQQGIEAHLGGVKDQADTLQTTQADLATNMVSFQESLAALKTELEDNRNQMKALAIRLDDLETSLAARMDAQIELLSGSKFVEKPLPSTVFNLANSDYTRGRDQEALKGFESYIKQFPKGQQVPDAKLKMADLYDRQKNPTKAIDILDQIVVDHPKSSYGPTALFKKAKIYESQGRSTQAIAVYQLIVKSYPNSGEARAAQQKSNELLNKK